MIYETDLTTFIVIFRKVFDLNIFILQGPITTSAFNIL